MQVEPDTGSNQAESTNPQVDLVVANQDFALLSQHLADFKLEAEEKAFKLRTRLLKSQKQLADVENENRRIVKQLYIATQCKGDSKILSSKENAGTPINGQDGNHQTIEANLFDVAPGSDSILGNLPEDETVAEVWEMGNLRMNEGNLADAVRFYTDAARMLSANQAAAESRIAELELELSGCDEERIVFRERDVNSRKENEALKRDLELCRTNLNTSESECARLKNLYGKCVADIADQESSVKRWQEEVEEEKQQHELLRQEIALITERNTDLQVQAEEEIKRIKAELDNCREATANSSRDMEEKMANMQNQYSSLEAEERRLFEEVQSLQMEVEERISKHDYDEVSRRCKELETQLSENEVSANNALDELRAKLKTSSEALSISDEKLEAKDAEFEAMLEQCNGLNAEVRRLNDLGELTMRNGSAERKRLELEIESITTVSNELRDELEMLRLEKENIDANHQESLASLKLMQKNTERLEDELKNLTAEKDLLAEQISSSLNQPNTQASESPVVGLAFRHDPTDIANASSHFGLDSDSATAWFGTDQEPEADQAPDSHIDDVTMDLRSELEKTRAMLSEVHRNNASISEELERAHENEATLSKDRDYLKSINEDLNTELASLRALCRETQEVSVDNSSSRAEEVHASRHMLDTAPPAYGALETVDVQVTPQRSASDLPSIPRTVIKPLWEKDLVSNEEYPVSGELSGMNDAAIGEQEAAEPHWFRSSSAQTWFEEQFSDPCDNLGHSTFSSASTSGRETDAAMAGGSTPRLTKFVEASSDENQSTMRLSQTVQDLREKIDELEGSLAEQIDMNADMNVAYQNSLQQLSELQKIHSGVSCEARSFEKSMSDPTDNSWLEHTNDLETSIGHGLSEKKTQAAQSRLDRLLMECSDLESQQFHLILRMESLGIVLESSNAELESLRMELRSREQTICELQEENSLHETALESVSLTAKTLETRVQELEGENHDLEERSLQNQAKIHELEGQFELEHDSLIAARELLKSSIESKDRELVEIKTKLQHAEDGLNGCKEKLFLTEEEYRRDIVVRNDQLKLVDERIAYIGAQATKCFQINKKLRTERDNAREEALALYSSDVAMELERDGGCLRQRSPGSSELVSGDSLVNLDRDRNEPDSMGVESSDQAEEYDSASLLIKAPRLLEAKETSQAGIVDEWNQFMNLLEDEAAQCEGLEVISPKQKRAMKDAQSTLEECIDLTEPVLSLVRGLKDKEKILNEQIEDMKSKIEELQKHKDVSSEDPVGDEQKAENILKPESDTVGGFNSEDAVGALVKHLEGILSSGSEIYKSISSQSYSMRDDHGSSDVLVDFQKLILNLVMGMKTSLELARALRPIYLGDRDPKVNPEYIRESSKDFENALYDQDSMIKKILKLEKLLSIKSTVFAIKSPNLFMQDSGRSVDEQKIMESKVTESDTQDDSTRHAIAIPWGVMDLAESDEFPSWSDGQKVQQMDDMIGIDQGLTCADSMATGVKLGGNSHVSHTSNQIAAPVNGHPTENTQTTSDSQESFLEPERVSPTSETTQKVFNQPGKPSVLPKLKPNEDEEIKPKFMSKMFGVGKHRELVESNMEDENSDFDFEDKNEASNVTAFTDGVNAFQAKNPMSDPFQAMQHIQANEVTGAIQHTELDEHRLDPVPSEVQLHPGASLPSDTLAGFEHNFTGQAQYSGGAFDQTGQNHASLPLQNWEGHQSMPASNSYSLSEHPAEWNKLQSNFGNGNEWKLDAMTWEQEKENYVRNVQELKDQCEAERQWRVFREEQLCSTEEALSNTTSQVAALDALTKELQLQLENYEIKDRFQSLNVEDQKDAPSESFDSHLAEVATDQLHELPQDSPPIEQPCVPTEENHSATPCFHTAVVDESRIEELQEKLRLREEDYQHLVENLGLKMYSSSSSDSGKDSSSQPSMYRRFTGIASQALLVTAAVLVSNNVEWDRLAEYLDMRDILPDYPS